MSQPPPTISLLCAEGDHADCAHKFATAWSLFSRSNSGAVLCMCACHDGCSLAGQNEVPEEVWFTACVCPGSDGWRESQRRTNANLHLQRERQREVMQSIDLGRGRSADEIERLILDGYATRGWEQPTDFKWASRFIAAATATRGRGIRLLVESGQAMRAARTWLRESRDRPGNGEER